MVILRIAFRVLALVMAFVSGTLLLAPLQPSSYVISYGKRSVNTDITKIELLDVFRGLNAPLIREPVNNGVTSWSSNGEQVAFVPVESTLLVFDLYTHEITAPNGGWLFTRTHAWSPTDDCLSYSQDHGGLYYYCFKDSSPELLPIFAYVTGIDWSPDGQKLIYSGNSELYEYDFDTDQAVQITHDGIPKFAPGYTPDGNSIVYSLLQDGIYVIFQLNLQTNDMSRLVAGVYPSVSIDGRYMVFINDDVYGQAQLFLFDFQTQKVVQLTSGTARHFMPEWVPW